MTNRYILNSTKIVEAITVEYTNGVLSSLLLPLKHPLNSEQYEYLRAFIPFYEQVIVTTGKAGVLTATKEIGANVKIRMFCDFHMQIHGIKYIATKQDGSKIKPFKIWAELLQFYFTTDDFLFHGKHSISNLVKFYNELVVKFHNQGKSKHPDHYDEKYVAKLSQSEWPSYWAHLRSLGLEPVKDRTGKTIDWQKKQDHG